MNATLHWPTAFRLRMLATARPVCDTAATRPSSQITLGGLIIIIIIIIIIVVVVVVVSRQTEKQDQSRQVILRFW